MIAERLDRRLAILRGKRLGSFDPDQYYLDRARRARIARKMRCYLRDMRPVVLLAPRWSAVKPWLDDVAVDVMLGHPAVQCRTLSVRPLEGRSPHQTWNWLVHGLVEFCGFGAQGTASQVVSRHGFRLVLGELFRKAERLERRCLMLHGLEHLQVDALHDLLGVFEDHLHHRGPRGAFNLVLAGPPALPHLELHAIERLTLADFDKDEATEALAELLGPENPDQLRQLASRVGGIPEAIAALAHAPPHMLTEAARDNATLWQLLGALGQEIRRSMDIVSADSVLSARLEQIAHEGTSSHDPERDPALVDAGLIRLVGPPMPRNETAGVRIAPWARKRRAEVRCALMRDLINT